MRPREKAAISACGADLASFVGIGDILEAGWPASIVAEANHILRSKGLRIVLMPPDLWIVQHICRKCGEHILKGAGTPDRFHKGNCPDFDGGVP